ncbi:hypothetical protein RRG08_029640 [Elysia crispata]|uniref:Uncharacterized protein n=1 Tax=Elysia crispata TaxID=231223 RepID=A0AAE0XP87_9GAST|nr:hypothetical protein RRG08_029640 [Elysia crispata]
MLCLAVDLRGVTCVGTRHTARVFSGSALVFLWATENSPVTHCTVTHTYLCSLLEGEIYNVVYSKPEQICFTSTLNNGIVAFVL